ncbi:hypothetical protein [Sphingosinicella sp. CPCC 101087]|uniref:hypothetical protein n=1 Tax=Sphingosinicella sp. CPCC 101087 TaxID=2497754 RepID=UPI00101BF81B|nr:hypothetical protein [Sphingosinicella sp. CPCC 101087]
MGVGAGSLSVLSLATGGAADLAGLSEVHWWALAYLAVVGGAGIYGLIRKNSSFSPLIPRSLSSPSERPKEA